MSERRKRTRVYEQERLLLYVQERLAEAIERSGQKRSHIAAKLGVSRSAITQALGRRDGLTLKTAATIAHACGFRLVPALEPLPDHTPKP